MANHKFDPRLLKAAVFGANDGIVTTFAVVAGVAGAKLAPEVVLIMGIANMIADGLSMGLGDYLGERSERRMRSEGSPLPAGLWKTGLATFIAFVIAGTFPLIPYSLGIFGIEVAENLQFPLSVISTAIILLTVGSLRTIVTKGRWWVNGLEMLGIGAISAAVAYGLGAVIERYM